jgi:hypothetical protein
MPFPMEPFAHVYSTLRCTSPDCCAFTLCKCVTVWNTSHMCTLSNFLQESKLLMVDHQFMLRHDILITPVLAPKLHLSQVSPISPCMNMFPSTHLFPLTHAKQESLLVIPANVSVVPPKIRHTSSSLLCDMFPLPACTSLNMPAERTCLKEKDEVDSEHNCLPLLPLLQPGQMIRDTICMDRFCGDSSCSSTITVLFRPCHHAGHIHGGAFFTWEYSAFPFTLPIDPGWCRPQKARTWEGR